MTNEELLQQRAQVETEFLLCKPDDPRENELATLYKELDRQCREVFGKVIPPKV